MEQEVYVYILLHQFLLLLIFYYLVNTIDQMKHVYYSVVPPLVYVGYVIVLGHVFHIRWYGDMLAPYNFLNYGAPTGWFGFDLSLLGSKTLGIGTFYMIVVLLIIFIGLGTLFLKLKRTKKDLY